MKSTRQSDVRQKHDDSRKELNEGALNTRNTFDKLVNDNHARVEARGAKPQKNTDKVADITEDTVTPEDKTDLENAKADLEKALESLKQIL